MGEDPRIEPPDPELEPLLKAAYREASLSPEALGQIERRVVAGDERSAPSLFVQWALGVGVATAVAVGILFVWAPEDRAPAQSVALETSGSDPSRPSSQALPTDAPDPAKPSRRESSPAARSDPDPRDPVPEGRFPPPPAAVGRARSALVRGRAEVVAGALDGRKLEERVAGLIDTLARCRRGGAALTVAVAVDADGAPVDAEVTAGRADADCVRRVLASTRFPLGVGGPVAGRTSGPAARFNIVMDAASPGDEP